VVAANFHTLAGLKNASRPTVSRRANLRMHDCPLLDPVATAVADFIHMSETHPRSGICVVAKGEVLLGRVCEMYGDEHFGASLDGIPVGTGLHSRGFRADADDERPLCGLYCFWNQPQAKPAEQTGQQNPHELVYLSISGRILCDNPQQADHSINTINQHLAAVRRLACEAADCGLLSPDLAAGIGRVNAVKQLGQRSGNWLTLEQSSDVLNRVRGDTVRAKRDFAIVAMLLGCGLRRKGGTPARLGYYDNYLVDNHSCVIVGVQATAARMSQETVAAQEMLTRFAQWQGRDGEFLQWLVDRSITPYMRTRDSIHRKNSPFYGPEHFTYQPEHNRSICPAGQPLKYGGRVHRNRAFNYIGNRKRCGACLQKAQCTSAPFRSLIIHQHESARQRARELAKTEEFAKAQRQRKKVEAWFAELKNQIGLRRLRLRRLKFVREQFFLAAAAQNIKRLMRFLSQPPALDAMS
jgi:Transposase DDE domain